jgi:hypothetical protein
MPDLLTVAETAALLGITPGLVRRFCRLGRFPGAVNTNPENPHRGDWRIPQEAVENYTPQPRGWPKGKRRKPEA